MNKLYPKLLRLFILLSLLIPLVQRKGNLIEFYGDYWGKTEVSWVINRFRYTLGDSVFEIGLIDKTDWATLFLEQNLEDYQRINTLSTNDLRTIQRKLDQVTDTFKTYGIKTFVIIPPNKETIYPERVDSSLIKVIGNQSNLDLLVAYMKANGHTSVIDLRPALLDEKRNEQVYYATDTHWNAYGAYAGYQETMKVLNQSYPTMQVLSRSSLICAQNGPWSGDLFTSIGLSKKAEPHIDCVRQGGWLAEKKVIDKGFHYTFNSQGSLCAVVYHDSFADALEPYISESFREVNYFLTYSYDIDPDLVYSFQPDVVLIEMNERFIKYMKNFSFLSDTE